LRYQWQLDGVDIPNGTHSTLVVEDVQLSDEGAYTVLVSDTVGTVPSQPAFLYPLILPHLTSVPANRTAVPGEVIGVSASATGNPLPFGWEWRRISLIIASNTVDSRSVFFTFVNTNNPGTTVRYRVVIRSISGQDTATFDLTTLADSDGDGMPDTWESQYGFNSGDPADADLDTDSDGLTNRDEYLARTDPTDPGSSLRLGVSVSGGQPLIFYAAAAERTYTLQYTDAPGLASWEKLTDVLAGPDDRVEMVIDPAWTTNRFYRAITP
jgi:hypothetical protein